MPHNSLKPASSLVVPMLLLLACFSASTLACELTPNNVIAIQDKELSYLEGRIPPAFRHAVEDKLFQLSTTITDDCHVHMQANIDQSALREANQSLDENPAKRIMLASQGYALPDNATIQYEFNVDETLQPLHADKLQTSALGKARASIEMVYTILTQNRATNISETLTNNHPWSNVYKERFINQCSLLQNGINVSRMVCMCRAKALEEHVNERQMEHIDYIRSNPYAKATGADKGFSALEQKILLSCQE